MKILALENSTTRGSIALLENEKEPVSFQFENDRKHSGLFFQSLHQLGVRLQDLDAIIVGLGPGSYAGVRIAISCAIGLSAAFGAKLLGFPSICALEAEPNEYYVLGDARRNSYFFARIAGNRITEGIDLYRADELQALLTMVDIPVFASEELSRFPQATIRYPSAPLLGKLIKDGTVHSLENPMQPIYLREPHITIPNDERKLPLLG